MKNRFLWLLVLTGSLLTASAAPGAEPAADRRDVRELAEKMDRFIAQRQAEADVKPAPRADDAEFLRRVYLDLAGRIPSVEETRSFLDDRRADKREQLVDRLLASPRYAAHFTNVWRARLLPEANNNFQVRLQQGGFEGWLRKQLAKNAGYDQMVRDLLTAPVGSNGIQALALYNEPGPLAYYIAKELKPENLAASTARVFLGVSVECAQCHNHPFAEWKREQFWSFAAFFSGIKSNRQMDFLLPGGDDTAKHELTIPGTTTVVQAKFLTGTEPDWKKAKGSRAALAEWITSKDNPYFARATVNRMWAYFLGTGLSEPVDEMAGGTNKPSQPEVLDLLAQSFAEHQFDLKFLIRAITATEAYQRTSAGANAKDDPALFARMSLRGMTGEQLFDSVAQATGYRDAGGDDNLLTGLFGGSRSARADFLTKFTSADRPVDAETSILQALSLMNGKVTASATSLERSETLAAVADAGFLTPAQQLETLYLSALARKPTKKELDRTVKFVEIAVRDASDQSEAGQRTATNNALADVFWALLNCPEFVLNH